MERKFLANRFDLNEMGCKDLKCVGFARNTIPRLSSMTTARNVCIS
jgi:hypothetical protein